MFGVEVVNRDDDVIQTADRRIDGDSAILVTGGKHAD